MYQGNCVGKIEAESLSLFKARLGAAEPKVRSMLAEFEAAYRQRFAFLLSTRPVIVESVSVEVVSPGEGGPSTVAAPPAAGDAGAAEWAVEFLHHLVATQIEVLIAETAGRTVLPPHSSGFLLAVLHLFS
jgi:N-methylhydantoinase A/oxoprolinase/acetone carboxylase beta subunit